MKILYTLLFIISFTTYSDIVIYSSSLRDVNSGQIVKNKSDLSQFIKLSKFKNQKSNLTIQNPKKLALRFINKFDKYIKYNHETLADADLVGREEDGTPNHFVNVTGMQRLHNGAIWQQYEKTERLTQAMYELAKAAVGEDKANEILEQNEIKLLN